MKKLVCFQKKSGKLAYRNDIEDFQQLLRYYVDDLFDYTEDEDGHALPDEEWTVKNCNGRVMLQGRKEIESSTGSLDFDGEYNTIYVCESDTLDTAEAFAIINAYENGEYVDDELLDTACDKTGTAHVHSVEAGLTVSGNELATHIDLSMINGWPASTFREYLKEEGMLKRDIEKIMSAAEKYELI